MDGTAEGRAQSALAIIKQAAEDLPGGFLIYQAGGKILYANGAALDIFGCRTSEEFYALTGGTFRGLVCSEDADAVERSILEQIGGSEKHLDYVEYRIIRKDGAVRWVDDYGHLVHLPEFGDVYYVFLNDITTKRAAQEESRRRAEVIEGLSVDFTSIYLLNLDSGSMRPYRAKNSHLQEIARSLGTEEERGDWRRVLPAYAERYVLEEDRQRYRNETAGERIRERLCSERSYTVDYRCHGDGTETVDGIVYMQMSVVGIRGEQPPLHAVMGYRDVTEQILKVQREMAEKLHMELELEREKQASEAKSAFLFNISHDLRTPLNAISGFTALAKRHLSEPDRLSSALEKVEEAGRHLLSLIDDILELGRLDSGHVHLRAEACDLREQVEIVLDMHRPRMAEKHLALETDFHLPDRNAIVDPARFRRILDNLIGNAVKFTPEGGKIRVTARQTHVSVSGYARCEFEISDTGTGMAEEFLSRIFQAFERERSSTQTGHTGTGVGLAIAKSLLDMMGGSISVRSKKGEGSTFTVDLPVKLEEGETRPPELAEPTVRLDSGERRILLVEDIELNRMLAETLLTESGFLVESVPDGCDAVDAVRDHPPGYYDLVLMDIQMPVMNGYEAARAIRALGRADTENLPIIALSANAREEDMRMSIASGMNAHVAKPFDIAKLVSMIDEHTLGTSGL